MMQTSGLLTATLSLLILFLPTPVTAATTADPDFSWADLAAKVFVSSNASLYGDSDGYITQSSELALALRLGRFRLVSQYDHVLAFGPDVQPQHLSDGLVGVYTTLTETTTAGVSFGLASSPMKLVTPIGSLMTETKLLGADLTVGVARDLRSTTALEIARGIRMSDFYISGSRLLFLRFSGSFSLHHKSFSDQNSAEEGMASISRGLALSGVPITLGTRFNYQDYARPTHNGYFAPQNLLAPQAFWNVLLSRGGLNASMEMSLGRQFYSIDDSTGQNFGAPGFNVNGSLDVTYKLAKDLTSELSFEGSDCGFNTASPWRYFQTTLHINYAF